MSKPAARLGDLTAHGSPLSPGVGSLNVLIGGQPAWRGLSPALVQRLMQVFQDVLKLAGQALAAPDPISRGKKLEEMNQGVAKMLSIMASADQHACPVIKLVIPDGTGVVINGSPTVLINGLPACRMGDTIVETTSVNTIAKGELTVLIGGVGVGVGVGAMSAMADFQQKQKAAEEAEDQQKTGG